MCQFLEDIGRHAWRDVAELAISEVVTDAALHAHTPIEIRLSGYVDQVRVEVRDFNSTLPVQRNYDVQATTGRGMSLVAAKGRGTPIRNVPLPDVSAAGGAHRCAA